MKRTFAVVLTLLLLTQTAFAHRIDEYLQATMLTLRSSSLQASMRLIPGILIAPAVIAAIDRDGDGVFSKAEQQAYAQRVIGDLSLSLDGRQLQPKLISWSIPPPDQLRDGLGEIHIEYAVDLPPGSGNRTLVLGNHHLNAGSVYLVNLVLPEGHDLRILAQHRNSQQTSYQLDYQQSSAGSTRSLAGFRAWLSGLQVTSLFDLGMRHIAEGTDHLLFLLTLLLPAPLAVIGHRWGPAIAARASLLHIVAIVTAFTIGHSLTLTLAAFGALHIPGRPIEILIAVSILVSAVHALRPIVPGKEAVIAGCFGLIHGLAFASTLDRLGLDRWDRLAGIFAFNLGIEAMQMLVVLAILPSLLLLSRTRAYSFFRVGGALFAMVASMGWIVERLFNLQSHVDVVVNVLAHHALAIAIVLLGASAACKLLLPSQVGAIPALQPARSDGSDALQDGDRGITRSDLS